MSAVTDTAVAPPSRLRNVGRGVRTLFRRAQCLTRRLSCGLRRLKCS